MSALTFRQCCEAVVAAGNDPKQANQVNYAYGYAQTGLLILSRHKALGITDQHEIKVQALYIVTNITRWRGDTARAVRVSLKKIGGMK